MPYRDGTGPRGTGPVSGRGMRRCGGGGRGFGLRRGFGAGGFSTAAPASETEALAAENRTLKVRLAELEKTISTRKSE